MIVYKLRDNFTGNWYKSGSKLGGHHLDSGKIWPRPGPLRSAITYILPTWMLRKINKPEYKHEWDTAFKRSTDNKTVYIFEMKVVEKVPLAEWYNRTKKEK